MSLKNLATVTKNLTLVNTDAIVEQGRKAFLAMFTITANPFKSDRDRKCWEIGYKAAQQKWFDNQKKQRETERTSNAQSQRNPN